jgi:hypothetical protein
LRCNERVSLDNRSEQNGPIGGVGTRENAKGLDLRVDSDWVDGATRAEGGVACALRPLPNPVAVLVGAVGTKVNPRSGESMKAMVEATAIPTDVWCSICWNQRVTMG